MVNEELAENIRKAFESILEQWGTPMKIISYSAASRDEFGKIVYDSSTEKETVGVFETYIPDRFNYEKVGNLKEGEVVIIFKGNEDLKENDKIEINDKEYNIKNIESINAAGVDIVYQVIAVNIN